MLTLTQIPQSFFYLGGPGAGHKPPAVWRARGGPEQDTRCRQHYIARAALNI